MTGILQIAPNFGFEALRYNVFTDIESLVGFPCERSRMSRPISLSSTDAPKKQKAKVGNGRKKRKLSKGGAGEERSSLFRSLQSLICLRPSSAEERGKFLPSTFVRDFQ